MLGVGLWGITRQETMWRDEAATWQASQRSVPELWHLVQHVDVVHGLYYLLMHGVFAVFGDSLPVLRLPSVLAMAGAAAFVARIGAQRGGAATGLCAGFALALVPAVQNYAQEGRSYALVTLGAACGTWLLVGLLERPGRAVRWAAYAGVVLVAAWLNWFALLLLPAHAVAVLCARPGRAVVVRWTLASAVAVAGTLPLILRSRDQSVQVSWIKPLTPGSLTVPALMVVGGVVCAWVSRTRAGGDQDRKRDRGQGRVSLAAVALPLLALPQAALLTVSLAKPLYVDRYILFSHLGLALLIGAAAARGCRALARPGVAVAVCVGALGFVLLPVELGQRGPASRVDDVIAPANLVADAARAGDGVLFIPAARRDTALVAPAKFAGLHDVALLQSPVESGTLKGVEKDPADIAAGVAAHRRVLLVTDAEGGSTREADRAKRRALDAYFVCVADTRVHGRRVAVYERR
ncbi:glycosyltransferase family 39 protein [Streptomyces sp. NBC_00083]|uniref:glycosyltransferase family 39 protein n=1 Tax=Streptomyces sp. NBC_00083 TaxID=2975647 RepID=UPI00224CE4B3|nr:glycosyltransferase family 39 protein [Streptomyces sp. NBC_00083]MCX5388079.1 glycosyltransferase family 39 protein [Streptomyces sp. NBC_00083]